MIKVNSNYQKAFVEVKAVLDCLDYNEYLKIPKNIINAISENMDTNYLFKYNKDLDYSEWNLMPETKALLYIIFKNYLATEQRRNELIKKEMEERALIEKEKRKKYNPNDIFKNKNTVEITTQKPIMQKNDLLEYKENFIIRFKNYVMKLLHFKS